MGRVVHGRPRHEATKSLMGHGRGPVPKSSSLDPVWFISGMVNRTPVGEETEFRPSSGVRAGPFSPHCSLQPFMDTHTHFPPSFPTHLSPNVFSGIPLWAGSGALDSALTQIKETVLFLTYKYTLLILTPTVPGPVLTSGEPLALWAFVSSPKQQQRERERHPGFCCVPMHKALVIQQQGKG